MNKAKTWYILTASLKIVEKCRGQGYAKIQAKRLKKEYYELLEVVHKEKYQEMKLSPLKKEPKVLPPLWDE